MLVDFDLSEVESGLPQIYECQKRAACKLSVFLFCAIRDSYLDVLLLKIFD